MNIWIALVAIVAIGGGLLLEYQKNKLKLMEKSRKNENEVSDLRKEIKGLKSRIENLEAIAAGDPDEFSAEPQMSDIELDMEEETEDNQERVSNLANDLANKKRTR